MQEIRYSPMERGSKNIVGAVDHSHALATSFLTIRFQTDVIPAPRNTPRLFSLSSSEILAELLARRWKDYLSRKFDQILFLPVCHVTRN